MNNRHRAIDVLLAEIRSQILHPAGYPFDLQLLETTLQKAIEGRFGDFKKHHPLSFVATTSVVAVEERQTEECFTGSRSAFRCGSLEHLLPVRQPGTEACTVTTLVSSQETTSAGFAAALFGARAMEWSILGGLLHRWRYVMTWSQAKEMIEATDRGSQTGMRTDGGGNFFFTKGRDGDVCVGHFHRFNAEWIPLLDRLESSIRWMSGSCVMVPDFDISQISTDS